MKTVLFIFVIGTYCTLSLADDDMYTTKFDDMDIDAVLESQRMKESYMNCFMDKGKCTPAGEEAKKHIAEALETECKKCSEKQIENSKKVLKYFYEKEPEVLKQLGSKYDPDGKYMAKLQQYLKEHEGKIE